MVVRHLINAFLFGCITLFWSVTALCFLALRIPAQSVTGFWGRSVAYFCGVSIRVHGDRPLEAPAYIVMANHRSYFDPITLMAMFPRPLFPVAKKELGKIPLFGWALQNGMAVMIDRNNRTDAIAALGAAETEIRNGRTVLIFPEGTRGNMDSLKPFKKGGFHLAEAAQVPVLPIALVNTDRVLSPKSWRISPGQVDVVIGEIINPSDYEASPEGRSQLMDAVRAQIEQMRASMIESA